MPFSPLDLAPQSWADPSDISSLFQDAAGTTPVTATDDPVGKANDKSGNGHHLTQSTAGARPLYKTGGGLHWLESVSNDWLGVLRAADQPVERVSAWRILTLAAQTTLIGGSVANNSPGLFIEGTGTELRLFAGLQVSGQAVPAQGVDFVVTERYNGASSRLAIDQAAYVTGDAGANNGTFMTLFAGQEGTSQFIVARCYGVFERTGTLLTDAQIDQLRNYYAGKAGLPWFVPEPEDIAVTAGSYWAYRKRLEEDEQERDERWNKQRERIERISRLVDGVSDKIPDDVSEAQVIKEAEAAVEKAVEKLTEDTPPPAFDYAGLAARVRAADAAVKQAEAALKRYEARKRCEMEEDDEDVLLLMG